MKSTKAMMLLFLALLVHPLRLAGGESEIMKLETEAQRVSYAYGMDMAASFKRLLDDIGFDIDAAAMLKGIEDTLKNQKTLLTPEEARQAKVAAVTKRDQRRAEQGEKNKKEGELFLAENGNKDGVIVTASGLQYAVLREGNGEKPRLTDIVKVRYRATLLDGTEFASSEKDGQPATVRVDRVLRGWTEALQLMKVGSRYRVFLPPSLAFGARARGRLLAPYATVIYELELLSVEPGKPEQETKPELDKKPETELLPVVEKKAALDTNDEQETKPKD